MNPDEDKRKEKGGSELERNLKRIKFLQEDLLAKMQHIGELTGMSQEALADVLEDPRHFSPGQWEKMQAQKVEAEKEIAKSLGVEVKKNAKQRKEKKLSKKRRGKMLGMRRRWLSL